MFSHDVDQLQTCLYDSISSVAATGDQHFYDLTDYVFSWNRFVSNRSVMGKIGKRCPGYRYNQNKNSALETNMGSEITGVSKFEVK